MSKIAFITSHDSYAIGGYKIRANGYLTKPFKDSDLVDLVDDLRESLEESPLMISITENYKDVGILVNDINYIEFRDRKTLIHTDKDAYETYEAFNTFLDRNSIKEIFKISRSLAINTRNIRDIAYEDDLYRVFLMDRDITINKSQFQKLLLFLKDLNNG